MNEMYRQGDLLLIKKENLDLGEFSQSPSKVLREGSMTGHYHKLNKGQIFFREIDSKGVFAAVKSNEEGTKLLHDEHKEIPLPMGIYEVRRQREVSGYVKD